ncbi:hypothetical protein QQS21_000648 [Conoideocrella luteorostrata]|uniref:histidine kinase n=1 Tax=Conoideocrella luteorostrata TaxID=1105319 RepID=A0AAJ0D0T6_9HYPO|nr:hypothetical protein QQS21_000648 [Conoideocrella luteorostrata]
MTSNTAQRMPFFPKADAAVLSPRYETPPTRPKTLSPIYDEVNVDRPIGSWPPDAESCFYPPPAEPFAPASIPEKPKCLTDGYLRAFLAENERLRSSMLWYYTRDIANETEFLAGLQEKAYLAQESTDWEYAVIGILDVNFYIRLASIGLPLAILPRGETLCAHTVTQTPGSIFLLPDLMEDWRFRESPYVESGGLRAYAGAPLRLQHESGDCVSLGSLCVASGTSQEPLTRLQQQTLARLADWVVSDIIQCARARRQRERRQMSDFISAVQLEMGTVVSEEPVFRILKATYENAVISLQSSKAGHIKIEGRDPLLLSDFGGGLWEDTGYIDDFIANTNQRDFPSNKVVRVITAPCEVISGLSLLVVASKDFRLVFDDIDAWFIQACANMLSQIWHKRLLAEAMTAKEKFLRGISHQLRTPLHGILGSVELLAEELKLQTGGGHATSSPDMSLTVKPAGSAIYLDTIKSAGRDLISIINSMITLDRWVDIAVTDRDCGTHSPDELETELAREIRKTTLGDTRYRASVFFSHDLSPDCASFHIDLRLLKDSLLPLIINAIQNTPEGIVAVTASIQLDRKELTVDVEDTGCGIHFKDQQRIFLPYEKVTSHTAGAGLGLTLALKFATLLQGSVELVSSEVGRGSHFRATYREVECSSSPGSSQPQAQTLKNIPSKFHVLTSGSSSRSLCNYFTRFLLCHGFHSSDSVQGSFIIFDYTPDVELQRSILSQIPAGHAAICLVPASEAESCLDNVPDTIFYLSGPFLTSTMNSILEEVDKRLGKTIATGARLLEPDASALALLKIDVADPSTNIEVSPPTLLREHAAQPVSNSETDPSSASPTTNHQVDTEDSERPVTINPIFDVLTITKPTALLVDDNSVNLRIMQMYCKKRGLSHHCATDGARAVEIFSQQQSLVANGKGEGIQLIFMDLQMPVCDGIEATRQIRTLEKQNEWPGSILFIVTGQDSLTDRKAAEAVGANDYFVKPVALKILDSGVKRYFPSFELK